MSTYDPLADDWSEDDIQKWTREIKKDAREQREREGRETTLDKLQRHRREQDRKESGR
jgi:hypothetical protein